MKRLLLWVVWTSLALILCFATGQAQFTQNAFDKGAADTVSMVFSVTPVAATNQLKVRMDLWVFNDANNIVGASVGFKWTNSNLNMDSARVSPMAFTAFNLIRSVYEGQNINTTNANDRFLFAGARNEGNGVEFAPNRRMWASYYFTLSSWTTLDSIILDTLQYNSGTAYKFVDDSAKQYKPYWTGRIVVHDPAYVPPANILLSEDTVVFSATVGQPAPPAQPVVISSDGSQFSVSLIETTSWLLKSPNSGTTPLTTQISVNTTSLSAGVYFDSIRVESIFATNSPQYIYVRLDLAPPMPRIKAAPTSLFFNAVAAGANPPSQTLTITNIGGGTLNWTATNSQPWLTLTPGSGTDSGGVTVSCDITGLPTGTVTDTIVVSDPLAVNNPVRVPVQLNLGSNLPMIVAENPVNHYILDLDTIGTIFTQTFKITNGGVGTLDYTVSENSSRIQHITPLTGTAPQTLTVEYKVTSAFDGADFWDTVTVTSPQAVNSPYKVVLHLHYVSEPAVLYTASDTVKLTLYECQQGSGIQPPVVNLPVINSGGDDPVFITLDWNSTYCTVQALGTELPTLVKFTAKDLGLPLGVYYDTVTISSPLASNSPKRVIVKYEVVSATQTPQMLVSYTQVVVPYQEESGPQAVPGFDIENKFGGCMSWFIDEDVPWLLSAVDSGSVPGLWPVFAEAPGYVLGEYYDTVYVNAPTATNPLVPVPVTLRVWRFHGDWNYDGGVDILDLTMMIQYLHAGSNVIPQPTFLVGDCDCDNGVDIVDQTWLINYLFNGGDIPCGNPY